MKITKSPFFILILIFSSLSPAEVLNQHPGIGPVLVIGDSLAAGAKATRDELKPAGCLSRLPTDAIKDRAVSGSTSKHVLKVMNLLKNNKPLPRLIFISSGGNDARKEEKKPGSYPTSQTLEEMDTIFNYALQTKAVVAYLGLNPPVPFAARLPEISKLALKKGLIVIDGMNGFWGNTSLMADQIHPNDRGYEILCDRMINAISPYYP